MGVIVPNFASSSEDRASGAQIVDGGLRFDSTKTHHLKRTPTSTGNRRTWTFSCWYKITKRGTGANGYRSFFTAVNTYLNHSGVAGGATEDDFYWNLRSASTNYFGEFAELFRDPGGWMHIVWAVDTTQATASNRSKLYVNNVRLGAAGAGPNGINYPPQNDDLPINSSSYVHYIGANDNASNPMDGYLSNVYFIDGQQLDPSYFGYTDPLTNVWRPKKFKPQATPNNGTTWSSGTTTGNMSPAASTLFDGDPSTGPSCLPANSPVSFTFNNPPTAYRSIEIYTVNGSGTLKDGGNTGSGIKLSINGVDTGIINAAPGWYNLNQTGTINSFTIVVAAGDGSSGFRTLRIDGVELLDGDRSNIGLNGFYLPFDGSAPIGQDQSGRGNNWTPVNFGGSNTIEKATGALPILNTDGGGKVARVGVRTDNNPVGINTRCVLALPLVGIKSDFCNQVSGGTNSNKSSTNNSVSFASTASNFYGGSASFNGSSSNLTGSYNSDFNFGTGDFTVEMWVYPTAVSDVRGLFAVSGGSDVNPKIVFHLNSGTPSVHYNALTNGSNIYTTASSAILANQWSHLAFVRTGTTWTWFINGIVSGTGTNNTNITFTSQPYYVGYGGEGYFVSFNGYIQDLRVYKGVAKYTSNFIPASTDPDIVPDSPSGVSYSSNVALVPSTDGAVSFDGSGDYLELADSADFDIGSGDFTIEMFVNPSSTSRQTLFAQMSSAGTNASGSFYGEITSSAQWYFLIASGSTSYNSIGGTVVANKWTHLAYVRNGSTTTLYADGINIATANVTGVTANNSSEVVSIGRYPGGLNFNGFISNLHFVKGTALYTSNFTPPTGPISSVANTKLLCCKSNSSATAADVTPGTITANGNATASNFNPFTVNINTQRGKQSGWYTLNPLSNGGTLSNGNLDFTLGAAHGNVKSTHTIPPTGLWYSESTVVTSTSGSIAAGIGIATAALTPSSVASSASGSWNLYGYSSVIINRNDGGVTISGSFSAGDVLQLAVDSDNNRAWVGRNNVWYDASNGSTGNPATGSNPTFTSLPKDLFVVSNGYSNTMKVNFGQKPFKFPPPAGFQPLTLANTPRPTIVRPDQYVGIVTYTGNGGTQSLNVGFKPDFVWVKQRSTDRDHCLVDTVRGTSKRLRSNTADGETTESVVTAFNSNGFDIGSDNGVNQLSGTYVAWAWKAGGNSSIYNIDGVGYASTTAAGLTSGNITGASVNTKSGFSIIKYTGNNSGSSTQNISHGLGRAPKMMIVKQTSASGQYWHVYHTSLTATGYLYLNTTTENSGAIDGWNNTEPTSSVFTVGTGNAVNQNGQSHIAYLWAEIPGFSKFGAYTGNNLADPNQPFIYTGFRPRWILIRRSNVAAYWNILDTARDTYNVTLKELYPNDSIAEDTSGGVRVDFLSNGFKIRVPINKAAYNASGDNYIYAAFAEAPSINLYGAQSNAR